MKKLIVVLLLAVLCVTGCRTPGPAKGLIPWSISGGDRERLPSTPPDDCISLVELEF